jgi:putative transposase
MSEIVAYDVEMFYGKEKTFKDLNDLEKAIKDYINWFTLIRLSISI